MTEELPTLKPVPAGECPPAGKLSLKVPRPRESVLILRTDGDAMSASDDFFVRVALWSVAEASAIALPVAASRTSASIVSQAEPDQLLVGNDKSHAKAKQRIAAAILLACRFTCGSAYRLSADTAGAGVSVETGWQI